MRTVACANLDATAAIAIALGRTAPGGTFVALDGELGAGKTTFTRYFAAALGVPGRVSSPTFVLVAVHEGGRLRLTHADWYRLERPSDLVDLDLEPQTDGVILVEWASRFREAWPEDHLAISIEYLSENERRIRFLAHGEIHQAWLARALA
jgi:tRNA threonylcarbamoyladenosine biosynthesis protein TsaE